MNANSSEIQLYVALWLVQLAQERSARAIPVPAARSKIMSRGHALKLRVGTLQTLSFVA